jgi:hypothetical protein
MVSELPSSAKRPTATPRVPNDSAPGAGRRGRFWAFRERTSTWCAGPEAGPALRAFCAERGLLLQFADPQRGATVR